LWVELGDKYHSAWENLLKGISKGRLRSAVRHRSAEALFTLDLRDRMVTWPERKEGTNGWISIRTWALN
jgi:hypothetical protein